MLDDFTAEFFQIFKEKLISILHKTFQELEKRERTFITSFYVASITLISKSNKNIASKENYQPRSLIDIDVNIHLKTSKPITAKIIKLLQKKAWG